jgi:alpha-N-acetylglucosaminidase
MTDSFWGRPFIWNMLLNFGGRFGIIGNASHIATAPFQDRDDADSMLGIGISMESIYHSYPMFELMLEVAWRDAPLSTDDLLDQWFTSYFIRRYGGYDARVHEAWRLLLQSVYAYPGPAEKTPLENRPWLGPWNGQPYDVSVLPVAFDYFIRASGSFKDSPGFLYDAVDLRRQIAADSMFVKQKRLVTAFLNESSTTAVKSAISDIVSVLEHLDGILSFNPNLSFLNWVESALRWDTDGSLHDFYVYQAKNQVTQWGQQSEINDYAAKHWSGLVADYYLQRWQKFGDCLTDLIAQHSQNVTVCSSRMLAFEQQWNADPSLPPHRDVEHWTWDEKMAYFVTVPV